MKKFLLFLLFFGTIQACKPEEIGPQNTDPSDPELAKGRKVFLVNEGNFGRGGASISAYLPAKKQHYSMAFSGANSGKLIGDVAQQMLRHGDSYYIVVNASGYILVTDTATLHVRDTVTGQMIAPGYMAIHEQTGYVTDLFTSKLWLIDLINKEVKGHIVLSGSASHLVPWNQSLMIAVNDELLQINPVTRNVDTSFTLASTIDRMRLSPDGALWVLCKGNASVTPTLYRLQADVLLDELWQLSRTDLRFLTLSNNSSTQLYFAGDDGIYQGRLTHDSLELNRLADISLQTVYGFDADPVSGELYLSDALDFDQASQIYRFDTSGIMLDQFKGGIITNGFHFTPK